MLEIDFRKRKTKPTNPIAGAFYWVENKSDIQIWFSPTDNVANLILLNEKFPDYSGKIKELQNKDKELEELLKEISNKFNDYATESWVKSQGYLTEHQSLDGYAKKEDIPNLDEYVTEDELDSKGYLTEHQSLDDYVKRDEIKDYITSSDFEGYVTEEELEERLKDISPNITEEDIEDIVEKVNAKTFELKWKII